MRPRLSATPSSVSRSQTDVIASPASSSACRADALAREKSTLTPSTSAPAVAQRPAEGEDAAGGRDQVLDQKYMFAGDGTALDPTCCAIRLGLGPDVDHGQPQSVRDQRSERNACGDAAGDDGSARSRHSGGESLCRLCTGLRQRENQTTVHIEWRIEPRGKAKWRLRTHQQGVRIEKGYRNFPRRQTHCSPPSFRQSLQWRNIPYIGCVQLDMVA